MIKYQLLLHIRTDATSVLMWLLLPLACHTAAAQGNPYAMIGPVPMVEYAMPFERMPRLVNADTTSDTAAMLIDGYGGKIYFVDASDSILGTAELPEDAVLIWLSVDPMTDKYPGISPYHYCHWNPTRLIDPDGMEAFENDDTWRYNTETGRLTWINNEGGKSRQTVEMGHSAGKGFVTDQTVSFGGDISRMFDGSVISPRVDGMVNGGLDIGTGVSVASAGLVVGTGGSAISGGMAAPIAEPLGAAIVAAGGAQIMKGLKDIMAAFEGTPTMYGQHEMMRDACSLGEGIVSSFIKERWRGVYKSLSSIFISASWNFGKYYKATHPHYKGIPHGAMVKLK